MTFRQEQGPVQRYIQNKELDTETHKADVDSLLPHTGEDHANPATDKEIEFVNLISTWILVLIFPALVDTIVGVEVRKLRKRSNANIRNHFKKQKSYNLAKEIHKLLNLTEEDDDLVSNITPNTPLTQEERKKEKKERQKERRKENRKANRDKQKQDNYTSKRQQVSVDNSNDTTTNKSTNSTLNCVTRVLPQECNVGNN